ncbi:hypothetical protein OLZ32_35390 [Rhizobium sp. 1AS11]|uniref:hypothetical protein n=1 Tax=Rhizobium acaciae TaxID=2989736 RepID=UPI00037FD6E5|nr:hypothetical protein [Rhizobium acaciae]MCW1414088.1 hypothetical protein [Rhizobium acaciae]MCW1745651.1 hypothetical protein [Rhizobium acaciae]MCW1749089.1 hypothetical protein [Rhizobium acaciae]
MVELSSCLEHLRLRGVNDENGEVVVVGGETLPLPLAEMLDGLVENAAELRGLIEIGRAVRRGERVSAAAALRRLNAKGIWLTPCFPAGAGFFCRSAPAWEEMPE